MAHWLKAAEDLFEDVDRRAKLVVEEEQSNSQSPASNGQGSQAKRRSSKIKPQMQQSLDENLGTVYPVVEQTSPVTLPPKVSSDKDLPAVTIENDGNSDVHSSPKISNEDQQKVNNNVSKLGDQLKHNNVHEEDAANVTNGQAVPQIANGDLVNETSSKSVVEIPSAPLTVEDNEGSKEDHSIDSSENVSLKDKGTDVVIEKEGSQTFSSDTPSKLDLQKVRIETQPDEKKHQDQKPITSPKKVQDQLDQAQGLLKSTKTTGQSKEARLARVCAGLSSRLQEYKSENAQLEELLVAERDLSKSYEARIKPLQKDLSASKNEVTRVESNMLEVLAAKNAEIEALVSSMETLKKQAALSEGNLASLQANMGTIMRNRELTETRMMQALREELASAERRAEEERAAHNATKMAAMEREVELEHLALDASTALARIQRTTDGKAAKAVELEQKVECSTLNQELQDMEAHARRGQKESPEDANQVIQAWQEAVKRARQGQRDAESKLSSLEIGKTKVFLRAGQLAELDARRADYIAEKQKILIDEVPRHLQKYWRDLFQKEQEMSKTKEFQVIKESQERLDRLEKILNNACKALEPTLSEYENRSKLIKAFNKIARASYGVDECPEIVPYGSFSMDLFTRESDLDLSINFSKEVECEESDVKKLYAFMTHLKKVEGFVCQIECVSGARVPILRLVDAGTGIDCDISVDNETAIMKSWFVRCISSLDERFRKLCFLIKAWAKNHCINSGREGTLSSFSLILLVAFHLQTQEPPILPPFLAIIKGSKTEEEIYRCFQDYGKRNNECLAALFFSFFFKLANVKNIWNRGLCASTYNGHWTHNNLEGLIHVEDFLDRDANAARTVRRGDKFDDIYKKINRTKDSLIKFMKGTMDETSLKEFLFGSIW